LLNCLSFVVMEDMLILMDDGKHHAPTRKNILEAIDRVVQYSQAGDVVFIHYSGHGGRIRDKTGDESDGYDEVSSWVLAREIQHNIIKILL
jgi:hypothetical protein